MNQKPNNLDKWGPISKLSLINQQTILEKINYVKYNFGEIICDFDELPSGLIFIEKGRVREIFKDKKGEIHTINSYNKNQIIGLSQILRGDTNYSLIASEETDGTFIPTVTFLETLINESNIFEEYKNLFLSEILTCLNCSKYNIYLETKELIKYLKIFCNHKDVKLAYPGEFFLNASTYKYMVSSNNILDFPLGSIIDKNTNLKIKGKIPARLVPFKDEEFNLITNPNPYIKNDLENKNKLEIKDSQIEAFEDLYGNINSQKKYPHHNGKGLIGESIACLRMLARYFDLPFNKEVINNILISNKENLTKNNLDFKYFAGLFEVVGINANLIKPKDINFLKRSDLPLLTLYKNNLSIIWKRNKDKWLISIPSEGQKIINTNQILKDSNFFNNEKLTFTINNKERSKRFGFNWFYPFIKDYKFTFIQIIIASFFVQLLGLFNPLLIQQIIDAVINQGNLSSLNILGTVLIAMALSQALLGILRTYIFSDTTNRIDIQLGTKVINHLFKLPLKYFLRRQVGEVSGRLNELENIRQFLTSTALTAILDALFSVIYVVVMIIYSLKLTILSLLTVPFIILISFTLTPIISNQLRNRAEARAKVQSHLVEMISGIETVKNQRIELMGEWRWKRLYGKEIGSAFENTITTSSVSYISQLLAQISGLIVIWAGSILVIQGKLTIGQLIAFRILSGYVNTPLLRLSTIWHNFQETCLSIERLSDIIDTNKEEEDLYKINKPPIPLISGRIEYKSVSYKFNKNDPNILSNISLEIRPKSFVGVVGESGSGKSTLLKLLPRIFEFNYGKVLIDGFDISKVNLYSLRSQIGIVSQDNILFNDSIKNNISLTKPESSFQEILKAAKLSESHTFINKLSNGYGTFVGEKGASLSGGQRQRIAIARTLLMRPKILILDEATSSLDIQTESKILSNIFSEFKDSTIIFITHRLFNLIDADDIFVLNDGLLVEKGNHKSLIKNNSYYKNLYNQQFQNPL